jgi:hypothetical protein
MSELGHMEPSSPDSSGGASIAVHRKESGGGDPGTGGMAAAAVGQARESSAGAPLDPGTRGKMEGAFGADFSSVRVHTDGAANDAAKDLNAHAFAAGSDIYFDQGQYQPGEEGGERLIAHELAHVVQTGSAGGGAGGAGGGGGGGPATKTAVGAVSVSSVSDAAEQAADRAADAVVKGEPVGDVGTASAQTVHRDAIGDLKSAADGNWLGSVDDGKVLARTRALSGADKAALKTDSKYHALNQRIMKKLSTGNCLEYLNQLGGMDIRWKLYWLNEGSRLDDLAKNQWQWLMGYVPPDAMDELRKYPAGYAAFLRNAPIEMIPAWDRLQGLETGTWKGSAVEIRTAVINLNPAQKAAVRADNAKVNAIMHKCGDASERFRCVTYLQFPLKWSLYWLDVVKQLPSLTQQQWSQLLSEAPRAEYDELVGWAAMWANVQKHCPPAILQVTRQNSDPATAARAFEDPVQVDSMFATLGATGFLAQATRDPDPGIIDHIYVKARAKVIPTVDGLPTGAQMGAATSINLRKWFFTAASTDAECTKMFERRFRVHTTGLGTYDHLHDNKGVRNSVSLNPFTKQGLTQMWQVCETLPPAAVENNPHLLNILRDQNNGPGNAYYAGPGTGGQGDVLMGYGNDAQLSQNVGGNQDNVYQAGGTGPGAPAVTMSMFNATLRHEIGHAVDSQLGVMATWGRQETAGGWAKYDSHEAFVDAIIAAEGGMHYGNADLHKQYRKAMITAVSSSPKVSFSAALVANGGAPLAADPGGPVSVVWEPSRYSPAGNGPWYNHRWVTTNSGRNFHDAYDSEGSLYSFIAAMRTNKKITDYQWRAPGEWFAECYQVYYSETEAGPGTPVGGRLRARDQDAAQMISQICDRGFSPQQMGGGTVARTPGT